MQSLSKYLSISACVLTIGLGIGAISQHHTITATNTRTHTERIKASQVNHARQHFTEDHLKKQIDDNDPDLYTAEDSNKRSLNKGLSIALNDCHSMPEYDKNVSRIDSLLGNQLSEKILPIIKPTENENPGFNKPKSMVQNSSYIHVSYGAYDDTTGQMPVSIQAKYKTPPYDDEAGMGGHHKYSPKVHSGIISISTYYSPKSKQLDVNNAYNQVLN